MTLSEIITKVRNKLDDKIEPFLWDDIELVDYLNEGYEDFAEQTEIINDARTPTGYRGLCTINLVADVSSYTLHKKIINIKKVILSNKSTPLIKTTVPELDIWFDGWRDKKGFPYYYILDLRSRRITVVPYPTATEIGDGLKLYLEITRLPLTPLESAEDEPEFDSKYHKYLISYILMRAYEKDDIQTRRPDLARKYELEYLQGIERAKRKDIKYRSSEITTFIHEGLL